jgi:transposase
VNTEAIQAHIDEVARNIASAAHAVLIMDRAAWHATNKLVIPINISPILLPLRAPELNPVEMIWQYMQANWLSNRVFKNYDSILEAACQAWNNLIEIPDTITSIGMREWALVGRSE